ncbi:MAG: di-trans,poly-cis-decaprenylcistransferase [Terracidiphilus sp.]|nr:di-trans,poly-cis-decaprenylcistransferase [Terracidiphilus sp.]MDR3799319.1 di-trans,poly-cis-decaprenylcistransferase [Terracidiphilus sp.]
MNDLNLKRLHVAIIMDGNGRWAAQRGLPRTAGHRAGIAALRRVVERAPDAGIDCLTLYAFSSDNWKRPRAEVEFIFRLLRIFLRIETAQLSANEVRLEVIGRRDRLPQAVLEAIEKAERATAGGERMHLRVAIDYSSREAIARAAASAIEMLGPNEVSSIDWLGPCLGRALTAESGEVDLLIRTGGEKRLSDFLLWECAYTELVFLERMWPEFDATDLDAALDEFRHRERRFGGVPAVQECSQWPATV